MTTELVFEVDWDGTGTFVEENMLSLDGRVGFGSPGAVVADAGRMRVELDNTSGRYSPKPGDALHGKVKPGLLAQVRAVDGAMWWQLFTGRIERFEYVAGSGRVWVDLVDGIEILDRANVRSSFNQTEALEAVLRTLVLSAYPANGLWWEDYQDEGEVLDHVGQRWMPERTTVRQAVRDVVNTWYGRFWFSRWGDPSYRGRAWMQRGQTSAALSLGVVTSSGVFHADEMTVRRDVETVINRAQVVSYPNETIAAESALWAAGGVIAVPPGETVERWAAFKNEVGERCAAVDVVTPVAGVDFKVTEFRDGSGVDYSSDSAFSLGMVAERTRAKLTFANAATGTLYVQICKVRGKAVVEYGPVVSQVSDAASEAAFGVREVAEDLPMLADANEGQGRAEYLVKRFSQVEPVVRWLWFDDRDLAEYVNVYSVEVMDRVKVVNAECGLENTAHRIAAIEYRASGLARRVGLMLERCDDRVYWVLGRVTMSELGSTTRLGF